MRQVPFDPLQLQGEALEWWAAWSQRAEAAKMEAINSWRKGEKIAFKGEIWSELKGWLLENVFFGKCAYCEFRFVAGSFGDAEHWRPKGKVTVKQDGKAITIMIGADSPHPGYFWLAYDWRNLLPACSKCNSGEGKMNQFPIEGAAHVVDPEMSPDALTGVERPLLLNPYFDDPSQHLRFGVKGTVAGTDARGKASIEAYALDRGDLEAERANSQENVWMAIRSAVNDRMGDNNAKLAQSLEKYTGPKAQFSLAAKAYADEKLQLLIQDMIAAIGKS